MLIPKINFRKLQSIYKKKSDKSGQSSLVGVILASVIGTVIVGSLTQWYLSMNKTMDRTDDRLEAISIAMSEWQRLEHMSLDELEANRENYKTPYNVGDKFTVGVNLGEQGFFNNGTCNALTGNYASESPNCFKDTTMTVYDKDGKAIYTTRSLPLSSQTGGSSGIPDLKWDKMVTITYSNNEYILPQDSFVVDYIYKYYTYDEPSRSYINGTLWNETTATGGSAPSTVAGFFKKGTKFKSSVSSSGYAKLSIFPVK